MRIIIELNEAKDNVSMNTETTYDNELIRLHDIIGAIEIAKLRIYHDQKTAELEVEA